MNPSKYDITCAKCGVMIAGPNAEVVNTAFRGHEKEAHGFKTGQEWYADFERELDKEVTEMQGSPEPADYSAEAVLRAAKRAAGLEADNEPK